MSLEQDFTRYPISIYTRGVRIVLTFVLPFAFMNYFPATYFLQKDRHGFEPQSAGRSLDAGHRAGMGFRRVCVLARRLAPLPRNRLVKRALFLGGAAAVCFWPRGEPPPSTLQRPSQTQPALSPERSASVARTLGAPHPLVAYRASEVFPTASIIKVLDHGNRLCDGRGHGRDALARTRLRSSQRVDRRIRFHDRSGRRRALFGHGSSSCR